MAPFPPVIHSVTGILTGCNYSSSRAMFTRASDHMHFFWSEADSPVKIENLLGGLCVCVSVCVYVSKRKKKSPEQFSHSKFSHPVCWDDKPSGEEAKATSEWPRSGEVESSRARKWDWNSWVGVGTGWQAGRVIWSRLLRLSGPQFLRCVKQGIISSLRVLPVSKIINKLE